MKSKYYQARIKGTEKWIRLLTYFPDSDKYLCRTGKRKEYFWSDELADFC